MELLEGIETRKSFRAFKPDPVPKEILETILKAASRSPSYQYTQPSQVAMVSGKKREELSRILHNLAESNIGPNPDLPLPKVWQPELGKRFKEHSARRFRALGIKRVDGQQRRQLRLLNFYGAPYVLFLFMGRTLSFGRYLAWDYSQGT